MITNDFRILCASIREDVEQDGANSVFIGVVDRLSPQVKIVVSEGLSLSGVFGASRCGMARSVLKRRCRVFTTDDTLKSVVDARFQKLCA